MRRALLSLLVRIVPSLRAELLAMAVMTLCLVVLAPDFVGINASPPSVIITFDTPWRTALAVGAVALFVATLAGVWIARRRRVARQARQDALQRQERAAARRRV